MSDIRAFFDSRCTKCDTAIGWCGTMSDRPACPQCGHRPSGADLRDAQDRINKMMTDTIAEQEREKDAEWAAASDADKAIYAAGWSRAETMQATAFERGPLDIPSPYVATCSSDGKFHRHEHGLWLWGWRDYCAGLNRLETQKETPNA